MPLNARQLEQLRPLVEAETGMDFSGNRWDRLCAAVEKTLARADFTGDFDRLLTCDHVRNLFLEQLTAELTIGESFFFRNEEHFQALREHVIPSVLRSNADRREVRVWSAGCAAGEEPYSLAITLDQMVGRQPADWSYSILATDINTEFLNRARSGEFRAWSFRRTDIRHDPKYFSANDGRFCLRPDVRDRVRFVCLNLVKDIYPSVLTGSIGLDLILFRNVAIYLRSEVVNAIVSRFFQCLKPGGWLLLGEAEVSQVDPGDFQVRRFGRATFFQRPVESAPIVPGMVPSDPAVSPTAEIRRPIAVAAEHEAAVRQPASPPASQRASSVSGPARADRIAETLTGEPTEWQRIEMALSDHDFSGAQKTLDTIRDPPQRAQMRLAYVRGLLELSELARAREMLEVSLAEEPLLIDGHLLQASLAEERGGLSEADAACRKALYLDHNCAMAHFQLGLIRLQAGDRQGADRSFRAVEQLAQRRQSGDPVEHGDGVCYGRLWDMAQSMREQTRVSSDE